MLRFDLFGEEMKKRTVFVGPEDDGLRTACDPKQIDWTKYTPPVCHVSKTVRLLDDGYKAGNPLIGRRGLVNCEIFGGVRVDWPCMDESGPLMFCAAPAYFATMLKDGRGCVTTHCKAGIFGDGTYVYDSAAAASHANGQGYDTTARHVMCVCRVDVKNAFVYDVGVYDPTVEVPPEGPVDGLLGCVHGGRVLRVKSPLQVRILYAIAYQASHVFGAVTRVVYITETRINVATMPYATWHLSLLFLRIGIDAGVYESMQALVEWLLVMGWKVLPAFLNAVKTLVPQFVMPRAECVADLQFLMSFLRLGGFEAGTPRALAQSWEACMAAARVERETCCLPKDVRIWLNEGFFRTACVRLLSVV